MKYRRRVLSVLLSAFLLIPALSFAETRPQGSANRLDGRTLLISVYIEETDALWKPDDMAFTREAIGVAADYITAQAAANGHTAELLCDADDLRYTIRYEGADRETRASDSEFYDTMMSLIRKEIPLDDLLARYQTDSYGFICLLPTSGCAYALPFYSNYGEDEYAELCVIYLLDCYLPDGTYEGAAVYAHELLHLFGAVDLYAEFAEDGITNAVVRYIEQTCPDELMYTTYESDGSSSDTDISQVLSDITLYSVGLVDDPAVIALFPNLRRTDVAAFVDQTGGQTEQADAESWDSLWEGLWGDDDDPSSGLWDFLPNDDATPEPTDAPPAPTAAPAPGSLLEGLGLGGMDVSPADATPEPTDAPPAPTAAPAPGSLLEGLGLGGMDASPADATPEPTDAPPAPTAAPAPGSLLEGLGLGGMDALPADATPEPTNAPPAPTTAPAPGSLLEGLGLGGTDVEDSSNLLDSMRIGISAGALLLSPNAQDAPSVGSIFDFSRP